MVRCVAPQRLSPGFIIDSIHRSDPAFGYVMRRNIALPFVFGTHLVTNSLGLRDHEFGPKGSREFRILSLGDSYALGFGVELEQSYSKVLERELNRQLPATKFSVIDAGVEGYGTQQIIMSFERLRPQLHPDFVLATFVAGNDVYDNATFEKRLRTHVNTALGPLGRHLHTVRLLLRVTFPLWFFWANRDTDNIERTIELLREMESNFREAGLPYLILIIPARHQIQPRVEPVVKVLVDLGFENLVFRQNRRVIDHFQSAGVPFIDLWPALAATNRKAPVSFTDDSHLNSLGHEVIAHEVMTRVRDLLQFLSSRQDTIGSRHSRKRQHSHGQRG
jgi:lysophospholipase L1-like esterase